MQTSRERILALVAAHPGIHLREMPRLLGLSLRSVRYHVDLLADEGVVAAHRSGRFERFFPAGRYSAEDRALISALRVQGQRAILSHLSPKGPSRFVSLQDATGLSSATLARHLGRLAADRLIELGPDRRYRLHDPGATAMRLALYRRRFPDLLADAAVEIFDP